MATQYFVVLDTALEPSLIYEFTGGYQYVSRDSVILFDVLNQVVDPILNSLETPVTINFDNNTVIPPPNTTVTGWQTPNPVADVVGEWVNYNDIVETVTESMEFLGISYTYVIVNAIQPQYTTQDVVNWAKQVTLWWLWNTHKNYIDVWHMLIAPVLTLAQLDADYQNQYTITQNATTIEQLKAVTLIYPY